MTADPIPDGTLETRDDGRAVIRFERHLAHPVDEVWRALTTPKEMIRWWGEGTVELVEGGRFDVTWLNTDDEGNRPAMKATITRLDPPRLLETDGDEHGMLRWELEPEGEGTRLRFTSTLELPDEFRTMHPAGWHWHLDALETILAGGEVDPVNVTGWEAIHERYVAKLS
jgi:uncharacterized protein YndB with AHSA1/START domain